jgi:hypothetical protein
MQCENVVVEKRKKSTLTPEEREVIRSLFIKALGPVVVIILISSTILFFGLHFLMERTSFSNLGLTPARTLQNVSHFITAYFVIAVSNIVLILALSIIVLYLALHNVVMPVIRITHAVKGRMESGNKAKICVRESDKLFLPLVDLVNKLIGVPDTNK